MHVPSPSRRLPLAVLVAGAVLCAATVLSSCDDPPVQPVREIDPAAPPTAAVVTTAPPDPVAPAPPDVPADTPATWVLDVEKRSVARVDPATDAVVMVTSTTVRPSSFAVAPDAVWVASFADGRIVRVPRDGSPAARAPTFEGERPKWVAADATGVWVAGTRRDGRVVRYDPVRQRYIGVVATGSTVGAMVVGPDGAVYVVHPDTKAVVRIDPVAAAVAVASPPLPTVPGAVAVDATGVWVVGEGTVSRLDPVTLAPVATVPVGRNAGGAIAVGGGFTWYTDPVEGRIVRIDPATNALSGVETDARDPGPIAVGAGSLWVVTDAGLALSRLSAADGTPQVRIRSKVRLSAVLFG